MPETERLRLGDMLVAAKLITHEQLDAALKSQKASGRKLGNELVALGYLTEVQMTQILSNQLSVPWVSLYHVEFSRELLNLLPAQVAESCCAIPVYVRKVRRAGDTLFVAMDDPTNDKALQLIAEATGMPVKPMVAAPTQIQNAIRVYYFGGRPLSIPPPPRPPDPPGSPKRSASEAASAPARQAAPEPEPEPEVAPEPATPREPPRAAPTPEKPKPAPEGDRMARAEQPKSSGPRTITLTLLDGTTVKLPAPGSGGASTEEQRSELTTGDLISALLAKARGEDVSDVLHASDWETLFATLLTILLRKGLIADWEFVEEWKKRRGE